MNMIIQVVKDRNAHMHAAQFQKLFHINPLVVTEN